MFNLALWIHRKTNPKIADSFVPSRTLRQWWDGVNVILDLTNGVSFSFFLFVSGGEGGRTYK